MPVGVRCHSLSESVSCHVAQLQPVRSAGLLHTINILEHLDHLVRLKRIVKKWHEGQRGSMPVVSHALSPDPLHQSVLTVLCMSASHHDTLKHLGSYVTCVVVLADYKRLGFSLPAYRHPSGKPSSFCPGLGPAQGRCWFPVAEDGCSLTSCPGQV